MLKGCKALLCMALAAAVVFTVCACETKKPARTEESSAAPQAAAPNNTVSTPDETQPTTVNAPATADTPLSGDAPVTYNSVEIKQSIEEIDSKLDEIISTQQFSGALYVKFGNDYEAVRGKGVANKGAHKNNSIHTGVYSGSLTKLVTATAVMKLVETGQLELSSTIDAYFPGCSYAKDVTVERLLNMTSGIPGYVCKSETGEGLPVPVPELAVSLKAENTAEQNKTAVLNWILSQQLKSDAGSFSFSDSNYFLLGEIIAQVSGKTYEEYVKEVVFDPLVMKKTTFCEADNTARPYIGDEQSGLLLLDGVGYSSLGMVTDVSDLLKLTDGLIHDQVLKKSSFQKMATDNGSGYGYGAYVKGNRLTCFGQLDAYSAKLSFTTDNSQIYAAVSNEVHSDPDNLHRLFRAYLEKFRN